MAFLDRSLRLELVANRGLPRYLHPLYDNCINFHANDDFEFWPGKRQMRDYAGGKRALFRQIKSLLAGGWWEKVDRKEPIMKQGPRGAQAYMCQVYRVVYPPPTGMSSDNRDDTDEITRMSSDVTRMLLRTTGMTPLVSERAQEHRRTVEEHTKSVSAARSDSSKQTIDQKVDQGVDQEVDQEEDDRDYGSPFD